MSEVPQRLSPGPRNDLTDIPGLTVAHADLAEVNTGVTVILCDTPMTCGVDVRGGGPGTRETDLLRPETLVQTVDAICLSGGSVYGLAAADGVTAALGAAGRGVSLMTAAGVPGAPIVPAAILYDLANGGDKNWGVTPPYAALGQLATEAALTAAEGPVRLGRAGAAYGARAGQDRGGLGSASYALPDGHAVAALAAVNSYGSVRYPGSRSFWAAPFELDGEFGGYGPGHTTGLCDLPEDTKLGTLAAPRENTTLGVIAISTPLTQAEATRIAVMAQDGLARAIRPVHGPTDGDVIFVLAPPVESPARDPMIRAHDLTRWGTLAGDAMARAIARGIFATNDEATTVRA